MQAEDGKRVLGSVELLSDLVERLRQLSARGGAALAHIVEAAGFPAKPDASLHSTSLGRRQPSPAAGAGGVRWGDGTSGRPASLRRVLHASSAT